MIVRRRAMAGLVVTAAIGCGVPVDLGNVDTSEVGSSVAEGSSGPVPSTMEGTSVGEVSSVGTASSETSTSETDGTSTNQRDFALRFGDVPDVGSGSGSGSEGMSDGSDSDATGGAIDPDALLIVATNGPAVCSDPYAALPCPNAWSSSILLPPALQVAGAAGELFEVNGSFSETVGDDDECGFGGGALEGRFEITFVDDTRVSGRMFELAIAGMSEIAFDAPRCAS